MLAALDAEISQRALWIRPRLDVLLFMGRACVPIRSDGVSEEEDGSFGFDNSFELTTKALETAIYKQYLKSLSNTQRYKSLFASGIEQTKEGL